MTDIQNKVLAGIRMMRCFTLAHLAEFAGISELEAAEELSRLRPTLKITQRSPPQVADRAAIYELAPEQRGSPDNAMPLESWHELALEYARTALQAAEGGFNNLSADSDDCDRNYLLGWVRTQLLCARSALGCHTRAGESVQSGAAVDSAIALLGSLERRLHLEGSNRLPLATDRAAHIVSLPAPKGGGARARRAPTGGNGMSTRKRPACFISYCRESSDHASVVHLVETLRQTARNEIDFLFEREPMAGADLEEFTERLEAVDAVLLILTPEYKTGIEAGTGPLYNEFSQIILRYEQQQRAANRYVLFGASAAPELIPFPFYLAPILFSGTVAAACPIELPNRSSCLDFTRYRTHRSTSGSLLVSRSIEANHRKAIADMVSKIVVQNSARSEEVAKTFDELLALFFLNTKHEHLSGDPRFESELENIFVKTHAFKKVRRQVSYLLIGRKGSGKSTIVDYLARESGDQYNSAIKINVNDFELEYLYSILSTRRVLSEMDSVIRGVKLFEVVWELFITVCCMNAVVLEHEVRSLKDSQLEYLPLVARLLTQIAATKGRTSSEIDYSGLFRWCYAKIVEQVDGAIAQARNNPAEFGYDLIKLLDAEQMLKGALSAECLEAFDSILRQCNRRFLISLDGFDTAFEEFRVQSQRGVIDLEERQKRTRYEIDWLRGFAHIVIDMKSSPRRTPLANLVDFCATIPKDRYVEIRDIERDAYVYIGKCYEIRWSAIELVILLRKRLECITRGYKSNRSDPPHRRLEVVLSREFSYIPPETMTIIEEQEHLLPIFIDVLRHTFWRPREILIYFAKLIAVLRDIRKRNIEVTQFAVSKCIADTTREIIRTEFINEFQRHCTNLRDVVERFRRQKQILTLAEIQELIGGFPFHFVDRESALMDLETQLLFLYEIGFLGVEADKKTTERLKLLHSDIFWFNAGDEPFEAVARERFAGCKFIVHPIFGEFLDLDTRRQRMVMKFDWKYLQLQEAYVIASS